MPRRGCVDRNVKAFPKFETLEKLLLIILYPLGFYPLVLFLVPSPLPTPISIRVVVGIVGVIRVKLFILV